jgi:two-component system, cell cycle sensor histidine kinase and response regulator CckA
MSEVSRTPEAMNEPGALIRVSLTLSRHKSLAALTGATAIALGLTLPWPAIGLFAFAAGTAIFLLFALARMISFRHSLSAMRLRDLVATLCDEDPTPCIGIFTDGHICYQNEAARLKYGQAERGGLLAVFEQFVVSPSAVIHRLKSRAEATGSARDEFTTARGQLRVSVHAMRPIGTLWRLDSIQGTTKTAAESSPLPMLTVSRAGQVLFVNPAMADLVGRRDARLEQVVSDLPLRDGEIHEVATIIGPVRRRLVEVLGESGRMDLYFLPVSQATEVGDWTVEDAFPVPMLKLTCDGQIILANQRARELLGPEKLQGRALIDVVEGLGRPIHDWLADAAAGRGSKRPEVLRARRPDRETFLQFTLGRVVEEGETRLIGVLSDATELKSLEAQFVQSQKMQAIGQLAGGVAHDFNNLLTAISGHTDLLLLRHDRDDPEFGDLMQISQNANRAASLVGQLLAFSRKQNLQPEVLDLREVISDHTHLLSRLVGEQLKLEVNNASELPNIRADRRQFEQVMMNLVVNARDAMKGKGGVIRISTSEKRLAKDLSRDRATVPAGDYVVINVEDTGCGIPEDKLDKIFEPFYTTKKAGEGTGLGLSTVYGIVKQSGGFVFVDSVLGQGTQFTLYFPVERGRSSAASVTLAPVPLAAAAPGPVLVSSNDPNPEPVKPIIPTTLARGVILLVEDEAPVRAFASRALKMRGHTVIEAENGEDALRVLEDRSLMIDVFVTDVIMPGMDGPTWVSKALQERPNVRVVFMSGYSEDSVTDHRLRIPNSMFLPKPFSLNDLTAIVQEQLQLRAAA